MISFLLCLALLIVGYFVYGKIVDNTFGPDDRETPAVRINDGVDYVVMPQWKLFLVQLLNIAGLGPIFGALQGALWGPVVFLWITFGTIFAGGVHDYFSGMMSERNDGASIAEVTGRYLGPVMQNIMRVFSVVLLIMVGTVFAVGPAGLIVTLCKNSGMSGLLTTTLFWLIIILVYYFIATFISIDAIIGKIYPVFGICLIIMAVGVIFGIFTNPAYTIPEIWANFNNMHPSGTPIWSFMFITVACGAISGFHSTQSPLMARCMKSEKQGHFVFYGAMVCEGVIALIWAAAGCALYTITDGKMAGLAEALAAGQSAAIYDVCAKTMGGVGIALAMIGVVICPITSGDTAFRSARLTLADWFKIDQDSYANRLKLCVPVDHLRHHLCRRRARLLLRHDERAQRRRFHRRDHRQVLRPCDAERHARVLGGAAHHGGYCVRGGSRRPDRGAVQSERRFRRAHLAAVLAHHYSGVLLYCNLYLH